MPSASRATLPPGASVRRLAQVRALAVGFLVLAPGAPHAAEPPVRTEEPRAYGHVVGDLIERRVHLALPAGQEIVPDSLPHRGRVDAWLELRDITLESHGDQATLQATYQLVNAPQKVTTIALPAFSLALRERARPEAATGALAVGDWPVTVAPLTPEFVLARAGLPDLQPDIEPEPAAATTLVARLALWGALLVVTLGAWAVQRHPQLAFWRRRAPFRQAWQDLRRLARRGPATAELQRQALARLHRAFEATAGCALFAEKLDPLYAARPGLRVVAPDIDAFFAASRRSFFAEAGAGPPAAGSLEACLALSRRLAQLEAGA